MTNLLPPSAKKQIVIEYWTRVICAWVILWSVCLLVGSVLLWPTYVLLTGNNEAFSESVSAATERTQEFEKLSADLSVTSRRGEEIVTLSQQPLLSEIITSVRSAADPTTISLDRIGVVREEAGIESFQVSGIASDRQALADFRDQLERLSFVREVELPIANLAQNQDIPFSLSVAVIVENL